jgi:hypothetical protein
MAPVAPVPHEPGQMPGPPVMPAPEQPCTTCGNQFVDDHVGPRDTFWVRPEIAYLWFAAAKVPPLAQATNGTVLLGGGTENFNGAFAGILHFGAWINDRHTMGVYAGGMMSDKRSVENTLASDQFGNPGISRPFVNALTGLPDTVVVSGTNGTRIATGSLASTVSARIDGIDAGLVWNVIHCPNESINFTFGYRYVDLDEQLAIFQATQYPAGGPVFGGIHPAAGLGPLTGLGITDRFRTRNQFQGAEFGLDGEWNFGPVFVELVPKVAFGTNRQTTDVDGATNFIGQSGTTLTLPGGLYSVGDLYGHNFIDRFAVLADVTGRVGLQLTACARVTVGYNFLYLNNVARPGLEIQPVINPRVIPSSPAFGSTSGPLAPQRAYDRTDYVAHGVNVGFEVRY